MTLLILSFIAGVLTVAAPCVLTLLPVIVGGTLARTDSKKSSWARPFVVAGSLLFSIVLFTLLLKATTAFLGVPQVVWQLLSGLIIILLGLTLLWPAIWEKLAIKASLPLKANLVLGKSYKKKGLGGDVLTGFALGPVFTSCSPTYAFVVASIIPRSFAEGLLYLLAYGVGLAGTLLIITYAGQGLISKLGWLSDPKGRFRRIIGTLFIAIGIAVVFGLDKKLEAHLLELGWYKPISNLENLLR